MASHSRPLANILCKGTKKSAPKKGMVKMDIKVKKETGKK
jgi:hypothetical protein